MGRVHFAKLTSPSPTMSQKDHENSHEAGSPHRTTRSMSRKRAHCCSVVDLTKTPTDTEEPETLPDDIGCRPSANCAVRRGASRRSKRAYQLEEAWSLESITLPRCALEQLRPWGLLDDTVLEFFIGFLHRYALPPSQRDRCFFFNSYFYPKLVNGGDCPVTRHAAVRTWTNRIANPGIRSSFESSSATQQVVSVCPGFLQDTATEIFVPDKERASLPEKNSSRSLSRHHDDGTVCHLAAVEQAAPDGAPLSLKPAYLWEFDVVVVPLHSTQDHHWALALVCYPFLALRTATGNSLIKWPVENEAAAEADQRPLQTNGARKPSTPTHTATIFPSSMPMENALIMPVTVVTPDRTSSLPLAHLDPEQANKDPSTGACQPPHNGANGTQEWKHSGPSFTAQESCAEDPAQADSQVHLDPLDDHVTSFCTMIGKHHAQNFSGIPGAAIFYLDSMEGSERPSDQLRDALVGYIQEEFRARCPDHYARGVHIAGPAEWIFHPCASAPQQKNIYDCGIFLIEYLRHLLSSSERLKTLLYDDVEETVATDAERSLQPAYGTCSTSDCFSAAERPTLQQGTRPKNLPQQVPWFDQATITHRRRCLHFMLNEMRRYPAWKSTKNDQMLQPCTVTCVPLCRLLQLFHSVPALSVRTKKPK